MRGCFNETLVFYVARFFYVLFYVIGKFCEVTSFFSYIEQKIHRYNNVIMPREFNSVIVARLLLNH